jgi:hypothetical protein
VSYLHDVERALVAVGIPRSRRRRIVDELADHLASNPDAQLGEPGDLAHRFADEIGSAYARRAGFVTFLALVPFGVAFAALFAFEQPANAPILLGTQLAFVGGMLAVLRAWRLRSATADDARVLRRRVGLALIGAALTVAGLMVEGGIPSLTVGGVGTLSLVVAALALAQAARLQPSTGGPSTATLATDLGRDGSPWRLALLIAAGVAFCIAVNGAVQSDPFDGLAAGIVDGTLCLGSFAALGRWLGLR